MKIENMMICIVVLLTNLVDIDVDFKDYENLKINNVPSINPMDLPLEFGEGAFKTVDEFIKKTHYIDCEWVIHFDYVTGEILKCKKGGKDNVSVTFEEGEFEGHHVASIHNHPQDVYSPPSGNNFGILLRSFEDFELIAGSDCLWILKAVDVDMKLNVELKLYADLLLDSCQDYCKKKYGCNEKAYDACDIMYGVMLSNYINDKNINHIQLTKKEYKP